MTTRAKGATLTVRQVRSGIGYEKSQNATLKALGLGRIGKSRALPDNDQVRGMIYKVCHLVQVESRNEGAKE